MSRPVSVQALWRVTAAPGPAHDPAGGPRPVRRLRRVPLEARPPRPAGIAELSPAVHAALDAVVIVDPIDYQRRHDETGDAPLRTLHFGTNILWLFWENRGLTRR
jgi:hypothetical protein